MTSKRCGAAVLLLAILIAGSALAGHDDRGRDRDHRGHRGHHGHPADKDVSLVRLGHWTTGVFDDGASEIVAYDPGTMRLFSINGSTGAIDVLDLSTPATPTALFSIDVTPWGKGANHVDVHDGMLAAAVENDDKQADGQVVFFATDGDCAMLNALPAGALPDMCLFTPDGRYVLVANEGEPDDDYLVDPVGSVTIVDLRDGVAGATAVNVGFEAWNGREDELRAAGVRIFGPGANTAMDLEPEYIAVSHDGRTAWVALQEANALAIVDIRRAEVTDIVPLGFKDHLAPGNGFDASNRDDMINIANWPTRGMYMPDGIASYRTGGRDYVVSANEGDSRDYDGYSEEERVKDLDLDPTAFPDAATLQEDANLGRLLTTSANGDTDGDGDWDVLYSYGARSMSIWNAAGELVADTGDLFEQVTAAMLPGQFNSNNDDNDSFDSRSDDKGPEPEGVAVARLWGRHYAFVGLERMGGVFVMDVTDPREPRFVQYVNDRQWDLDAEDPTVGDLGPEGLRVVEAADSPTGRPLLLVANEVSGSISVYEITQGRDGRCDDDDDGDTPEAARGPVAVANTPNPFNPITTISYSLPRATDVRVAVYNLRGQLVDTLVQGPQAAGDHVVTWSGAQAASGIYLYMVEADGMRVVQRMSLVK
ncbi:choice-of-anchor I family protein [bacterium]|nr:choice-of-anchor I family protein [bacterium]